MPLTGLSGGREMEEIIKDGFRIKQTSYRSWEIIDPDGREIYVWADPHSGVLHCSCGYYVRSSKPRVCKHIRLVKELFNHVRGSE